MKIQRDSQEVKIKETWEDKIKLNKSDIKLKQIEWNKRNK